MNWDFVSVGLPYWARQSPPRIHPLPGLWSQSIPRWQSTVFVSACQVYFPFQSFQMYLLREAIIRKKFYFTKKFCKRGVGSSRFHTFIFFQRLKRVDGSEGSTDTKKKKVSSNPYGGRGSGKFAKKLSLLVELLTLRPPTPPPPHLLSRVMGFSIFC